MNQQIEELNSDLEFQYVNISVPVIPAGQYSISCMRIRNLVCISGWCNAVGNISFGETLVSGIPIPRMSSQYGIMFNDAITCILGVMDDGTIQVRTQIPENVNTTCAILAIYVPRYDDH